jgi:Tfp pilus assembly protein PilV
MLIKKVKSIGNKGQTLIEALVAVGIFLISINAIIFLLFAAQSIFGDTERNQAALNYASEGAEAVKSIRNRNWDELTDGEHGLIFSDNQWLFSETSDSKENLTRKIIVTTQTGDIKNIKSLVSWQINPLNPRTLQIEEILTRWKIILDSESSGGEGNGGGTTGDWLTPQTLSSIDIGPGNEGSDVAVMSSKVYISSIASDINKPDLFIFDVSNPSAPFLISQKDLGIKGLNSLSLFQNYLYAVSSDNNQEFLVIDISNPASPSKIAVLDLTGEADALSVFYYDNFVYVGRNSDAGQELTIINVSNPSSPTIYSGLAGIESDINDIFILNNKIYLAVSGSSEELIIADINNPASPQIVGSINIGREPAFSVFVQSESRVFIGGNEKLYTVNAVNPNNIFVRGSIATSGRINDIFAVGNLAFLATSNSNKEFQVINITDPNDLQLYSSFNFSQVATGVDYADNLIFVSVRSNDALRIITSAQL